MNRTRTMVALAAMKHASTLLFVLVAVSFGLAQPSFLSPANLLQIVAQSVPTSIVAMGVTFVLLTGGVDLSVGSIMFVGAALAGRGLLSGVHPAAAVAILLGVGAMAGLLNATLVIRLRILPFIATLGILNVGRGLGLWISETRAMNLPDAYSVMGHWRLLGLPLPLWILAGAAGMAHMILNRTPFGRRLYAIGHDAETARKVGIAVDRHVAGAYILSGLFAGLGGVVALAQLGAVSPRFGDNYEFEAITAAVLGGASLHGGRGNIFPGPILGAMLVKAIFNGLVMVQADPYLFPLITSTIIFSAVLLDGIRDRLLARLGRRPIMLEGQPDRSGSR